MQPYEHNTDPLAIPDDSNLLSRAKRGDQSAFAELLKRHGRYLYGVAFSISRNASDAEDIVQETLLAALSANFRGESAVRTWLVAILVRQAAMLRRKKKPLALAEDRLAENQETNVSDPLQAKMDLAVMLQSLSPEHREVIVLRELEQMSYEQIAATLNIPRGTVESRLHRARESLREKFKGY